MPPAIPNKNLSSAPLGSSGTPSLEEQKRMTSGTPAAGTKPVTFLDSTIDNIGGWLDTANKYWSEKLGLDNFKPGQVAARPTTSLPTPGIPTIDKNTVTGVSVGDTGIKSLFDLQKSPTEKTTPLPNKTASAPATTGGIEALPDQDKAAWLNNAYKGIAAEDTPQREIPCPNCSGSFLIKYVGRVFKSLCGWLQKTFNIREDIIDTIKNYVIERLPQSKRAAFKDGCPVCGGKGTLTDPSDDRAKYAQAAKIAQSKAPEIEENEAKLGTGGNEYKIVAGHVVHEVGLGINDAPSYRVDYGKGYRLKGMADWGKGGMKTSAGPLPEGSTKNHVQGINTIASPGGQYTIKCSNKFSLLAGALGVEITTGGPVTIKGGITRITGPEITIGTQTGTLGLEGEVVNIVGKSIEVGPKDGQFIVKGSMGCTGQSIVGGHLHAESASVVKLATVGRNEASKVSSSNNIFTGPAFWGGAGNIKGLKAALSELLAYVLSHATNPELSKHIVSKRYIDGILDNNANIAYMLLPEELQQTGYAVIGPNAVLGITSPLKIPVYNYPHIHAQFDQPHYHETRIPDIDCTADDAKQLRAPLVALKQGAPMHIKSTSIIDVGRSIWSTINLSWLPTWDEFTKFIRNFFGGR